MKKKTIIISAAAALAVLIVGIVLAIVFLRSMTLRISSESEKAFKSLGFKVTLDNKTVTIKDSVHTVVLENGRTNFTADGNEITPDIPQQIVNNTYYIPVRDVAEAVGAKVEWDSASETAAITYNDKTVYYDGRSDRNISIEADADGIINAYAQIIQNVEPTEFMTAVYGDNWDKNDPYNLGYAVSDVDNNGIPELIISRSERLPGSEITVYTYKGGKAVECGKFSAQGLSKSKKAAGLYTGLPGTGLSFTGLDGTSLIDDDTKDIITFAEVTIEHTTKDIVFGDGKKIANMETANTIINGEIPDEYDGILASDGTFVNISDYIGEEELGFTPCSDLSAVNSITLVNTFPVYTQAETAVSQQANGDAKSIINAYTEIINNVEPTEYLLKIGNWDRNDPYNLGYALCDFDNNSIPELVIVRNMGHIEAAIYTYKEGKAVNCGTSGTETITKSKKYNGYYGTSPADRYYFMGFDGTNITKDDTKDVIFFDGIYRDDKTYDIMYDGKKITNEETKNFVEDVLYYNGITSEYDGILRDGTLVKTKDYVIDSNDEKGVNYVPCHDLSVVNSITLTKTTPVYTAAENKKMVLSVSDAYKQALSEAPKKITDSGYNSYRHEAYENNYLIKSYSLYSIDGDDVPELIIHYCNEDDPSMPRNKYKIYSVKYYDIDGAPNNGVLLDCGVIDAGTTYRYCGLTWFDYKNDKCLLLHSLYAGIGWRLNYDKPARTGFELDTHSMGIAVSVCEYFGIPVGENGSYDGKKLEETIESYSHPLESYDINNLTPINDVISNADTGGNNSIPSANTVGNNSTPNADTGGNNNTSNADKGENNGIPNADIEDEVLRIRQIYNEIVEKRDNNGYLEASPGAGVTSYLDDNGQVRCMIVKKGTNNSQYTRYYYYENNKLIFAYLEAGDAHRLYFKNDKMFRWRYSANAAKSSEANNHDNEDSQEFRNWESFALNEGYMYPIAPDIGV